jgi:RND superfamily putative drug exporter
MSAFTRWVLGHKLAIAAFWLVTTIVGFAFVQTATNALSQQFSLPGQKAYETNVKMVKEYGNGGPYTPAVAVVRLPPGKSILQPDTKAAVEHVFQGARQVFPAARTADYFTTKDSAFISNDGRTTFELLYLPPAAGFGGSPGLDPLTAYFDKATVDGAPFHVTGIESLAVGSSGGGGPGVFAEAMFGGIGALIVLVLVFRSFMALVPLLMAVVTIPTTFLVVWGLTAVTQVSFIVEFLIALIGLGVAIDYSLLIVLRWREERAAGLPNEEAVQRAMERAGLAVIFSGTTVAIGLFALIAIPVPFLQSVGYGGMLIPLVSVLVATTLLPVVLAKIGPRVDWPKFGQRHPDGGRLWSTWGRLVVRYRWPAIIVAVAILGALVYPLGHLNLGTSRPDSLAKSGSAYQGLQELKTSGIGEGVLMPFELLVKQHGTTPIGTIVNQFSHIAGARGAVAPDGSQWMRGDDRILDVYAGTDASSGTGLDVLSRVQHEADSMNGQAAVGGAPAQGQDFIHAVYGNFPLMIVLIIVITFVLLARAFRSVILPLKAVALNVLSVGAAWGAMTLVWQDGHGSSQVFGVASTGSITSWIPVMVFAFLFGLSMDYEVFILSRTREEYDRLGNTDDAMALSIGRTGRLVTSAALILFLAFVSLGSGPETDIKVLATGLAVGILLDATVIRCLLVPAVVSVLGKWNWWLPAPVAKILRVQPSS